MGRWWRERGLHGTEERDAEILAGCNPVGQHYALFGSAHLELGPGREADDADHRLITAGIIDVECRYPGPSAAALHPFGSLLPAPDSTFSQSMTNRNRNGLSPSSIEFAAGLSAGLISTLAVHPLDIIKTRLQVDTTGTIRLGSSLQVLRGIIRNEGPTRLSALYRGLSPNLLGNSLGWALYFLWYRQAQDVIRSYRGYSADRPLTSLDYLSASAASGILSAVFTNPIWVIKTRMLSTSATQRGAYPSMVSGLKSIWHREGYRGMFHGLVPTLAGVSHGALYFVAYEKLKAERRRLRKNRPLTNLDTIMTSSLSKVFAGGLTYPHQLVRARMQMYHPGDLTLRPSLGIVDVIKQIWRREGFFGFYKGLGPNLLRVVPSTCVTFLVYENVRWTLPRMLGSGKGTIKDGAV